jgi:hypothetical protein
VLGIDYADKMHMAVDMFGWGKKKKKADGKGDQTVNHENSAFEQALKDMQAGSSSDPGPIVEMGDEFSSDVDAKILWDIRFAQNMVKIRDTAADRAPITKEIVERRLGELKKLEGDFYSERKSPNPDELRTQHKKKIDSTDLLLGIATRELKQQQQAVEALIQGARQAGDKIDEMNLPVKPEKSDIPFEALTKLKGDIEDHLVTIRQLRERLTEHKHKHKEMRSPRQRSRSTGAAAAAAAHSGNNEKKQSKGG